jgi:hypothetical protein
VDLGSGQQAKGAPRKWRANILVYVLHGLQLEMGIDFGKAVGAGDSVSPAPVAKTDRAPVVR